ncbi:MULTISPECIES: hypothetical protein [unclassified Serratia (in: enterobacteria)]|uniref:hypothetical protein n=1 Tax=unclassified Serratia (in: enterobacteria) TaxID=2647522 RepID=UPI0005073DAD|nr:MULTISPECIES: hypothetical protein [unclassified Serratia (in: enterobacteria)]KFK92928.1 hypothetical protein JV45_18530 [Serratia sp. Ag2]KFL00027.1 hypothetical protein IV04_03705 [Serratia sp. Ag1]
MATKKKPQKATQAREKLADKEMAIAKEKKRKREADKERQAETRRNLQEALGKNIPLRLHSKPEKRLQELCKLHGRDIKEKTRSYSQMISDLINFYYIESILKYENEELNKFYDTYVQLWGYTIRESLSNEEIADSFNKEGFLRSCKGKNGGYFFKNNGWTAKNVETHKDLERIITVIESFE